MHPILVGQRRLDEIARPAVEEKPDAVVDADQPIAVGPRRTAAFEQNALIGIGGKDADAAAALDRTIGENPGFERQSVSAQRRRAWNVQFAEPAYIPSPVYLRPPPGIVPRLAMYVLA